MDLSNIKEYNNSVWKMSDTQLSTNRIFWEVVPNVIQIIFMSRHFAYECLFLVWLWSYIDTKLLFQMWTYLKKILIKYFNFPSRSSQKASSTIWWYWCSTTFPSTVGCNWMYARKNARNSRKEFIWDKGRGDNDVDAEMDEVMNAVDEEMHETIIEIYYIIWK
jgi:hypothetical protein